MKYDSATIDATFNDKTETLDLETVNSEEQMIDELWATFTAEEEETNEEERDDFAGNVTFTNPQGFAVHLFMFREGAQRDMEPVVNFDDILGAWNDEDDEDRREAMGEYLDDMGAADLSDFDEAYQGQFDSGAAFAEDLAESLGAVPKENVWVCIDWERTWEANLRHDYHMTDSGHVFRHL